MLNIKFTYIIYFSHLLNNNLKILEKDAFYGLNSIVNLFLDNNYLEFLNLDSWKHMIALTWLYNYYIMIIHYLINIVMLINLYFILEIYQIIY